MGVPTLFLTVPDLLDTLRFSFDSEETTFEDRFDEIRNSSLLILDDFGTQNATSWAQEKLFQIINYRYINKLPLVITTNLSIEEIEPRIRSRMQDPDLVSFIKILAPDYRRPADEVGHLELSSLVHLKARAAGASGSDGVSFGKSCADESTNPQAAAVRERPPGVFRLYRCCRRRETTCR